MRVLLDNIKSVFNVKQKEEKNLACNYENNYYGDQVCQRES